MTGTRNRASSADERPRRRLADWALIALAAVVSVVSLLLALGLFWTNRTASQIPRLPVSEVLSPLTTSNSQNFLVISTDSGSTLSSDDRLRSPDLDVQRAVSAMAVLRVARDSGGQPVPQLVEVALLPPATSADTPTTKSPWDLSLQDVYRLTGPEALISGLQERFDLPIHGYVEVDLGLVDDLLRKLGPVEVPADTDLRNPETGDEYSLGVDSCARFDAFGLQSFLRDEVLEERTDAGWTPLVDDSEDGEDGSARRQFAALVAVSDGVEDPGFFADPRPRLAVLDGINQAIRVDDRISRRDLRNLAQSVASTDQTVTTVELVPPTPDQPVGAVRGIGIPRCG